MINFLTYVWVAYAIIFLVWCFYFFYCMPKSKKTNVLVFFGLLWTSMLSIGVQLMVH